jgi:iron complex transport system ATP-binding protein
MYQKKSPQLSASQLELGYQEPVIKNLKVAFVPGSVTGILGANGSGKSTLLKGLARIQNPTKGVVLLDGKNVSVIRPRDYAKQVGILAQHPVAPDGITVEELVARGRFPHQGPWQRPSKKDREVVAEVIERVGLKDFRDRPLNQLSGGQRQRAWVAMALAQEPEVLLLDEPTTYLDLSHQLDVLDLLISLNRERNITVVMVLHDLNLAARFCDQLLIMDQGQILVQGEPHEVITPTNIAKAFKVMSRVIDDPVTGKPMVVPIRNLRSE